MFENLYLDTLFAFLPYLVALFQHVKKFVPPLLRELGSSLVMSRRDKRADCSLSTILALSNLLTMASPRPIISASGTRPAGYMSLEAGFSLLVIVAVIVKRGSLWPDLKM